MTKLGLRYDDANMWAKEVGKTGVTPTEWKSIQARLSQAKRNVQRLSRTNQQGFLQVPFDRKAHEESVAMARRIQKKATDLVVLGIGGSDLGARALQQALADGKGKLRVHFAGSTTDPHAIADLIKRLDFKKTALNIVSKSGDTLEPVASFLVLRDRLVKAVGSKRFGQQIVATTDTTSGSLMALAKKEKYHALAVPRNVGGRYSVLTPVGLFPAVAMGIDTEALLSGARAAVDAFHESSISQCLACRFAGLHVIGSEERKQRIQVTMAYSSRLSEFGRWVRQLVAESLGKQKNRLGKTVHAGLTPIACTGPEDQHSQLQLWSEGPFDKLITFLEIESFQADIRTPSLPESGPVIEQFGRRSFSELIHLERRATAEALRQDGRSNATLVLERLDARTLGELIIFFELTVALMGELMNIDAFDQPGVELMKKLMRSSLTPSLDASGGRA
jgi:glucose-6-phosphate isomerase